MESQKFVKKWMSPFKKKKNLSRWKEDEHKGGNKFDKWTYDCFFEAGQEH